MFKALQDGSPSQMSDDSSDCSSNHNPHGPPTPPATPNQHDLMNMQKCMNERVRARHLQGNYSLCIFSTNLWNMPLDESTLLKINFHIPQAKHKL